jgi:hypothetical protein
MSHPEELFRDAILETFKERMELIASLYGEDIPFYRYSREDLVGVMPPLNKQEGQKWLWRIIDSLGPDAIFFDSIMCLLVGSLGEEEPWESMLPLVRGLARFNEGGRECARCGKPIGIPA